MCHREYFILKSPKSGPAEKKPRGHFYYGLALRIAYLIGTMNNADRSIALPAVCSGNYGLGQSGCW